MEPTVEYSPAINSPQTLPSGAYGQPRPGVRALTGGCRSCRCPGYRPNSPKNNYCADCGHHYNNHA
jgi:hypothetical protein